MKKEFDFRTHEDRLRDVFGWMGFKIFTLRGWFGKGFVAVKEIRSGSGVIICRKDSNGGFELQMLESPSGVKKREIAEARLNTKLPLPIRPKPYNPTARKFNYRWQWLVPIKEQRGIVSVYGIRELRKEEVRKFVGAPLDLHREPAPTPLRVMPKKQYWGERKRRMQNAWR